MKRKYYFKIRFANAKNDPEKLVLPGIIYVHKKEDDIRVYWFGIGWWHYSLNIAISVKLFNGFKRPSSGN